MLASRAIMNWLHSPGEGKQVKSQPIWGRSMLNVFGGKSCDAFGRPKGLSRWQQGNLSVGASSPRLPLMTLCLFTWYHHKMPAWVTPAWAHPGCCTRARISLRYHVNAKQLLVLVWNRSAGRLALVAHALFLWFWITHVFYQHEVYLQIMRYEMTQSSSGLSTGASSPPKLPAS